MKKLVFTIGEMAPNLRTEVRKKLQKLEQHSYHCLTSSDEKQDLLFKALSLYCQEQRDQGDGLILTLQTHGFSSTVFYDLCNHNRIDCLFSTFLALGEIFHIPDDLWFIPLIRYLIGENKEP